MKKMKKVLSMLLLVCMLTSMCAVSAYADDPTGTLRIEVPTVASDYSIWNATSTLTGVNADEYEIKWYYTISTGETSAVANIDGSIGWQADRLVSGSKIYAIATNKTYNTKQIKSNEVIVAYTDHVDSVSISAPYTNVAKGGSVQLTATVLPATVTDKSVTWTADPAGAVNITDGLVTVTDSATNGQEVTIYATSTVGSVKSNEIKLKISVPVNIDKVEVAWNPSTNRYEATPTFSDGSSITNHTIVWSWSANKSGVIVSGVDNTCTVTNNTEGNIDDITLTAVATKLDGVNITPVSGNAIISSLPGKAANTMTVGISSSTLYAGRSYTLSAKDSSTNADVSGVTFTVVSDGSIGTATISGGSTIIFGLGARTIKVTATADGYDVANATFTVQPNATLSAEKDNIYTGESTALRANYKDGDKGSISDVQWSIQFQTGADGAKISGSTLTAGSTPGTVVCVAKDLAGKELGTVTVIIQQRSDIDFSFSIYSNNTYKIADNILRAKGGLITLQAANATKNGAGISGKFSFAYASDAGTPNGGIGLTDNGDGTATVSANYNGRYIIAATFTSADGKDSFTKTLTVEVHFTPTFVGGNYAVWDGVNGLDFVVNDSIYNWNGQIWVDGHLLSNANYICQSSPSGLIYITLKPEFISWLRQNYNGNGTHTISVGISVGGNGLAAYSMNGRNAATGYFKTWGTASSFNGVKTGDEANLALWATLLTVSAIGAAGAVVLYKRKKSKG